MAVAVAKNTTDDLSLTKLVHLDLKGAPLKVSYLEKIFRLLKQWGCSGVLMEYEDMFPYSADLRLLASPHAYRQEEIKQIIQVLTDLDLTLIPLVQTFGHMEFVLKHPEFVSLREVEKYPMALCPSNTDSLNLIFKLLDQVMLLHPDVTEFHIGCDEVFHLGVCGECTARMKQHSLDKHQLFFAHINKVSSYVRENYPGVRTCIVWDDMFRYVSRSMILGCGLGDLVEPMVWNYQPSLQLPPDLWDNLSSVFPNVWIASAFKGATGPSAMVTNINFHLDNHRAWSGLLQVMAGKFQSVRGIAITGWQRYDHYAILCELFPQGLPSLAVCLKYIRKGNLTAEDVCSISQDLGFTSVLPFDPMSCSWIPQCSFPGGDVYQLTIEFCHLRRACVELFTGDGVSGWLNDFNVQRRFINPVHVETLVSRGESLLEHCHSIEGRLEPAFGLVFVSRVLTEWKGCFLEPLVSQLNLFLTKTRIFVGD